MNAKTAMGMICAITASVMSVSAQAASHQTGLEACVNAMTEKLAAAQGGSPVQARISEESTADDRQLGFTNMFSLDAFNSKNNELVARMDCVVDARGKVLRLVKVSNSAPAADSRSL
jgi:hypothetical protein